MCMLQEHCGCNLWQGQQNCGALKTRKGVLAVRIAFNDIVLWLRIWYCSYGMRMLAR